MYINYVMFNPFQVVLKDPGHGKPADWWSLGIFFFDLVTGRSPFSSNRGKKVVKENIMKGKFNIPPYITQDAQDLLRYVSHAIACAVRTRLCRNLNEQDSVFYP